MSTVTQFMVFSVIGAFNTSVDFVVYYALTRFTTFGANNLVLSTIISFITASITAYILHSNFTFHSSHTNSHLQRYVKYLTVSAIALVINVSVFSAGLYIFYLHDIIAKAIAIVTVVLVSFLGNKLWAFRQIPNQKPSNTVS